MSENLIEKNKCIQMEVKALKYQGDLAIAYTGCEKLMKPKHKNTLEGNCSLAPLLPAPKFNLLVFGEEYRREIVKNALRNVIIILQTEDLKTI